MLLFLQLRELCYLNSTLLTRRPITYYLSLFSKQQYLLFLGLFLLSSLVAQTTERKCFESQKYYDEATHQQLEIFTQEYIKNNQSIARSRGQITIPVVVHVVYPTVVENISDEQIHSQIDALNRDFNALNENLDQVHPDFQDRIADVGFNFCLATINPEGETTNGITRTATDEDNVFIRSEDNIYHTERGGKDAWNTEQYLNIWVTRLVPNFAGFASKPGENSPDEDGVVISVDFFGQSASALPNFQLGRVGTHEVGHYFNLFHPFNDGCNGDDFVADLPQQLNGYQGDCETSENISCGGRDNASNFMNLSEDACLAMFTQGQAMRMQAALIGARSGLLNDNACEPNSPIVSGDEIRVFPNPASYYFCIEVGESSLEQIPYTVFNVQGAKVEDGLVFPNSLQHFPTYRNGVYFIQFMNGSTKPIIRKIIINN